MPRQGARARGAQSTRSPSAHVFNGFVIETYNHVDDLPVLSDAPKKRPRHATRGAAAAERRQESTTAPPSTGLPRRPSTRSLRIDPVPMKPAQRSRDDLAKALKHHDCAVCLRRGTVWMLLKCIRCARCVHSYCLNPPQTMQRRRGVWTCEPCSRSPPQEKRQAGRVFRDAMESFPFLVPHTYLDAMADSVALATAADVAGSNVPGKKDVQDLGATTTTDPPEPTDSIENTVVLKVESDDSELDDLRPLVEFRRQVVHSEDILHQHVLVGREQKRPVGVQLSGGASRTYVNAAGDVSTGSNEIVPAGTSEFGSASGVTAGGSDGDKSGSGRGSGRGSRRGRAPRTGKERHVGDSAKPSSSDGSIFVKLRRKPPAPQAKKAMDEKAKAEMCKRLEKARAKKAERRALAMLEKASGEKAAYEMARKTAMEKIVNGKAEGGIVDVGNHPIGQMGAGLKVGGVGMSSSGAGPSKIGMPNIGAAVTQIAAMQGVVTPMSGGPSQKGFGSMPSMVRASGSTLRNESTSPASRSALARRVGQSAFGTGANAVSPLRHSTDRLYVPERLAGNDRRALRRADAAPPLLRGFQQREPKLSASDPFGTRRPKVGPMEVIEVSDDSQEHGRIRMDRDGTIKPDRHGTFRDTGTIHIEGEKKNAEYAPRGVGSNLRVDRLTSFPTHGRLNLRNRSGEMHCIDVDAIGASEKKSKSKCTPEQRTVAKMANLFPSSVRTGDSNPRAVRTNWGEIRMDAKNEALLTLAKVQKGNIEARRSSAGMSSGSLDKDGSIRSAKTHARTDNVPESERKRMQVTAMMASDRALGTAVSPPAKPASSVRGKSSLSRLLLDPSAEDVRHSTHESALRRETVQQAFAVDNSAMAQTARRPPFGDSAGLSRRGDEAPGLHSQMRAPEVADYHVSQLRTARAAHVDPSSGDHGMARRNPIRSNSTQWEDALPEYESPRVSSRVGLPSSHSGSQSEPGSAAARGLTSVQTLKKPKKRATLAVANLVTHRKRYPDMEQPPRVGEVVDLVAGEHTSVVSRPDLPGSKHTGAVVRYPGHSQSSHERDEQNNTLRPNFPSIAFEGRSRRTGGFGGQPMEPPADPLGMKNRAHNDRYSGGHFGSIDPMQDVPRSAVAETDFSAPGEGQYRTISHSQGGPGGTGTNQNYNDTHIAHNQMAPVGQGVQGSHSSNQGCPSPVFPGDYARGSVDDQVRFTEGRRLRRSVAPTVPPATRQFQYEQGRQLARFTSSASEHQQPYSVTRRYRTQQRHPEPGLPRIGSDWEGHGENHNTVGVPATSYPAYSHERIDGSTPMLNHQEIAQEGGRPQLVPNLFESNSPLRNANPNSQSHLPVSARGYQDYARSEEQFDPYMRHRTVLQSRVAAPEHRRVAYDRSREPSGRPHSRLRVDGTSEHIGNRDFCHGQNMKFGHVSGFLDQHANSGEAAPISGRRIGEHADDQAVAQQAQPARTDPSLKNLLG